MLKEREKLVVELMEGDELHQKAGNLIFFLSVQNENIKKKMDEMRTITQGIEEPEIDIDWYKEWAKTNNRLGKLLIEIDFWKSRVQEDGDD